MPHRIVAVRPGSIASRCPIKPGHVLLAINGKQVRDQIDYQAFTAVERLQLTIETEDEILDIHLEKDAEEPLGLQFESTLMSRPRTCANDCMFCFVAQMPPSLRPSLYVRDDDWRLSLMMGNYITLTNLKEREFQRIIDRHASPLYLSIHATDGDVRARMMNNPGAAQILPQLRRLAAVGIRFHCQIVLCRGVNDGAVLDGTLRDLSALAPAAISAAVVPVGLTRHRGRLAHIEPWDARSASEALTQIHRWQDALRARLSTAFVFAADEFYCLSGTPFPDEAAYEDYPQIENGVGLVRQFLDAFQAAWRMCGVIPMHAKRLLLATGVSMAPILQTLVDTHPVPGAHIEVRAIHNRFFGETITVAGLLTGQDLLAQLRGAQADLILIPAAALKPGEAVFLDDMTLEALQDALGIPVSPVENDGAALVYALTGLEDEHG